MRFLQRDKIKILIFMTVVIFIIVSAKSYDIVRKRQIINKFSIGSTYTAALKSLQNSNQTFTELSGPRNKFNILGAGWKAPKRDLSLNENLILIYFGGTQVALLYFDKEGILIHQEFSGT